MRFVATPPIHFEMKQVGQARGLGVWRALLVTVGSVMLALGGIAAPNMPITTNTPLPEGVTLRDPLPGPQESTVLWYRQPPTQWLEALPLGNGSFGGMVFGGVSRETIQYNHDTLWTRPTFGALKSVDSTLPDVRAAVGRMRALIFSGDPVAADKLYEAEIQVPGYHFGVYQPMATLRLEWDYDLSEGVRGYQHRVDLSTAVVTTEYSVGKTRYRREGFAVPGRNLLVCRVTANGPDKVTLRLKLEREGGGETFSERGDRIGLRGAAIRTTPETEGTRFVTKVAVLGESGNRSSDQGILTLEGAGSAVILIAGATDFQRKTPFLRKPGDLGAECDALLASVTLADIPGLLASSIKSHREAFGRLEIDVNHTRKGSLSADVSAASTALPDTRDRLGNARKQSDNLLALQVYDYARYLLICSSRPGSMPANLQGLWNDLPSPPWNSDYHFNINVQMNYLFAGQANLVDSLRPYLDFLDTARVNGRKVAREMFGARGFLIGHATAGFATTLPLGKAPYAIWETGAAWGVDQVMDYVRFSGDLAYLRGEGLGLLEEAALFLLDWTVPHPRTGEGVIGPGTSPEHFYVMPDGRRAAVDMGCTMDQQLAWQVFSDYLEAADLLRHSSAVIAEVRSALAKLAPTRLTADGRIREWFDEHREFQGGHRHLSHLYAFYPGRQFNREKAPEMIAAAQKSVEFRKSNPGGAGKVGWSRMWIGSLYARFHQGDKALEMLEGMLADQLFPNLFGKYNEGIFQIDGNFGYAGVINEMLLQSQTGRVELLPALPVTWKDGSVRGMCARGGYEFSFEWADHQLVEGRVKATRPGTLNLRYREREISVAMPAGTERPLLELLKP